MLKAYGRIYSGIASMLTERELYLETNPDAEIELIERRPDGSGPLQSKIAGEIEFTLRWIRAFTKWLDLDEVDRQIERLFEQWRDNLDFSVSDMRNRLILLHETIDDHLFRRKLLYVKHSDLYEAKDLFGPEVADRFHAAKDDIAEAGKCLALGRSTATVFHCMRVAEIGLQSLAKDLNVLLKNDRPLEYEDWTNILQAIEGKIEALRHPKTAANQESIQFYSETAAQFRYLKDAFRNHVSHAREHYDLLQAESIFGHVREFMQDLAKRLGE